MEGNHASVRSTSRAGQQRVLSCRGLMEFCEAKLSFTQSRGVGEMMFSAKKKITVNAALQQEQSETEQELAKLRLWMAADKRHKEAQRASLEYRVQQENEGLWRNRR